VILRYLLITAICVNGTLGLLLLYVVFLRMPYLNLQHIDVHGARHLSREEVVEASDLEGGTNLLTVNLGNVAGKLRRHPWIRSASVFRRFPGRIIIEIQERIPRAILAAGRPYYVDETADYFTRVFPGDPVNYPLFTGVKPDQLGSEGPQVREMLRRGLALLDLLERKRSGLKPGDLAEIRIDLNNGFSLITMSGRTIVLGKDRFAAKIDRFARLKRFLARRRKWGGARFIDLDYDDRALVRSSGARRKG
jgi:cell division protein FtsQ